MGLQHVHVAGLEGTGGAALLVAVKVQPVTIEIVARSKQLPTNLAFELPLLVIPAYVVEETSLDIGREVTVMTLEHFCVLLDMLANRVLADHLSTERAGGPSVGVNSADVDLEPSPGDHLLTKVTLDPRNNFHLLLFNSFFSWIVCVIFISTHNIFQIQLVVSRFIF